MKYQPKKIGKKPEKIALFLFFVSIVAVYGANAVVSAMQWILQVAAVIILGIFIYILVRWSYTDYMYEIRAKSKMETMPLADIPGNRLLLYVHKKQGSRAFAAEFVCNIGDIKAVEQIDGKGRKNGKRFYYYRNMSADNRYMLTVDMDGEPVYVFLELGEDSEQFLSFINSKIN